MDFIVFNGDILQKQDTGFTSFFWDEPFVISQKMWFGFGGIPLFDENIVNIKLALNTLNANIPALLNDEKELFRLTKRMLNKNRFYRSGIITCQVFIGERESNLVMSSVAFPEFDFPLLQKGLSVNFSEFEKYSGNPLNQFAFSNIPWWNFAEARNHGTHFQNSVILNEKGSICECISANIFMIQGKTLFTPAAETGCYVDTLRGPVLQSAQNAGLKVAEADKMGKDEIIKMDEIFLAGEECGIQWVLGVGNKRFVRSYAVKIHEHLNKFLAEKCR